MVKLQRHSRNLATEKHESEPSEVDDAVYYDSDMDEKTVNLFLKDPQYKDYKMSSPRSQRLYDGVFPRSAA